MNLRRLFVILILFVLCSGLKAQQKQIDLFLDCGWQCDFSYIKSEINYINYVRDRFDANVYVKVTSQGTASGGRKVVLYFEGQNDFEEISDSLIFFRSSVASSDEYRQQLVKQLQIGLIPYLLETNLLESLDFKISKNGDHTIDSTVDQHDRWNMWVFRMGFNGNMNKDDLSSSTWTYGSLNASKVTEKFKFNAHSYISYNHEVYQYDDDEIIVSNTSYGGHMNAVNSIAKHWSVGGSLSANSSSYSNYKYRFDIYPAIEYSFFPYEEATKKSLTLFYRIGPSFREYFDTTIYNETTEMVWSQNLSVNLGLNQKWGKTYAGFGFNNYLNPFTLGDSTVSGLEIRSFHINGSVNIRVVKGLNINLGANAHFNKGYDPNIPAESFTLEELLTNSRVYKTDQSFHFRMGINYRFGSIYNNIVNPRFNSSDLF